MPLFEYECRGCGKQFEYLTRDGQSPSCPACHGADPQNGPGLAPGSAEV